ncbi:LysE family translocator [Brevibacillus dissolubilis]|uniref:LysE family translocator n=1 Tax=Brevibacillus dissolubilis TaxID=1844116 RepID=UPI00111781D0|nr:LysE family translocator [Brevibacillus dissolubilis]
MTSLLSFFILSLFVVISPGLDTALITKTTIASGRKNGFYMALGISTGCLVHTFAAALGLSAILMKSALAFEIVKYVGAIYLIYIGATSLWGKKKKMDQTAAAEETVAATGAVVTIATVQATATPAREPAIEKSTLAKPDSAISPTASFKQGLFTNILNPKVAIFFLTFLPQFVETGSNTVYQLILMGTIHTVLSIVWFLVYVVFINYLREWLLTPKVQGMMEKATGLVLIGFGIKLALEKHR